MDSTIDTPAIYSSPSPSYSPIDTALDSDATDSDASSSMVVEVIDGGLIPDGSELVINTSESGSDQAGPQDRPAKSVTLAEINYDLSNRPTDPHFCIYQRELNSERADYFSTRADAASSSSGHPPPPNNHDSLYDASDEETGDEKHFS